MKFSKVQLIYRRKRTQPRNRQLPQVVGRAFSSASSQHGRAQWRRSSAHPAAAGSTSAAARSGAGDGAVAGAAPRADSHLRHARFDPRWVFPSLDPRSRPLLSHCLLVLLLDQGRPWHVRGLEVAESLSRPGEVGFLSRCCRSMSGCCRNNFGFPAASEYHGLNRVAWKQLHE
jgi:hypothetical protein